MPQILQELTDRAVDFLPLRGLDHLAFRVGNAKQAAYFYRSALGMRLTAYCGPETGARSTASYVLLFWFSVNLRLGSRRRGEVPPFERGFSRHFRSIDPI